MTAPFATSNSELLAGAAGQSRRAPPPPRPEASAATSPKLVTDPAHLLPDPRLPPAPFTAWAEKIAKRVSQGYVHSVHLPGFIAVFWLDKNGSVVLQASRRDWPLRITIETGRHAEYGAIQFALAKVAEYMKDCTSRFVPHAYHAP